VDHKEAQDRFADNLRKIRKEKNFTQEQLAEVIGKSTEHISFLERGERSPSFEIIVDLADALDIEISHLMDIDYKRHSGDLNQILSVTPVDNSAAGVVKESFSSLAERKSDLDRFEAALAGIREMQHLANEYGIRDILQDNGGKVLQVLILLGLRISPGREGNDAVDDDGNEYELKTINRSLNRNAGVTTHHHLNKDILTKYRAVKAWFISVYEGIELIEIYRVETVILEPLFKIWEERIAIHGALNNPKIPMRSYVHKGEIVYPVNLPKQGKLE